MTHRINIVTGNAGKARLLAALLPADAYEIVQHDLPLIEPQANSIQAVALSKAHQGFQHLAQPVVVEDSGFYIDSLAGFPGPYTRYILETIGVAGLLRLMHTIEDRRCRFESALVYIDSAGTPHTFADLSTEGQFALHPDTTPCPDAWSELWRIFIPAGYDKPLTAFTSDERAALLRRWQAGSVYNQFARWLLNP